MVYSKAELKKYETAKAAVERSVYLQQLIEQSDRRKRKKTCLWFSLEHSVFIHPATGRRIRLTVTANIQRECVKSCFPLNK